MKRPTSLQVWGSALLLAAWGAAPAFALEQRVEDLAASVEVAGVFELDITHAFLTFPNVTPGETTILGEGHFHNQVRCRSNYGRPWYLKAQVVSLRHTSSGQVLPASLLQWKVVDSTGAGRPSSGGGGFQEFSEQPTLVYAAVGDDLKGQPVELKFQYSLTPPAAALAGTYVGQIVFTLVESP